MVAVADVRAAALKNGTIEGMADNDRIAEIRARERAATPGDWQHVDDDHGRHGHNHSIWNETVPGTCAGAYIVERVHGDNAEADAEFLAHARSDVPWLLRQIEVARPVEPVDEETLIARKFMVACQETQRRGAPLPDAHEFTAARGIDD